MVVNSALRAGPGKTTGELQLFNDGQITVMLEDGNMEEFLFVPPKQPCIYDASAYDDLIAAWNAYEESGDEDKTVIVTYLTMGAESVVVPEFTLKGGK